MWIDPDGDVVRYGENAIALTERECQLLQFLLDHPHRFHSAARILGQAWGDSALSPEEVRNYVQRLRRVLRKLQVPCKPVNRPGFGYSLELNAG